MPAVVRAGPFRYRLKSDWAKRFAHLEGRVPRDILDAPITADHPGVSITELVDHEHPPERLVYIRRTKPITQEEEIALWYDTKCD